MNLPPPPPRRFLFCLVSFAQCMLSSMDDPSAPIPVSWVAEAAGGGSGNGLADLLDAAAAEVPPASPDAPASRTSVWGTSSPMACGAPPRSTSGRVEPAPAAASKGGAAAAASSDVDARGGAAVPPPLPPPPTVAATGAAAFLSPERLEIAVRIVATAEWHRHHRPGGYRAADYADSDDEAGVGADDGGDRGGGRRGGEEPTPGGSPMECVKDVSGAASAAAAAEPTNEWATDEELTDEDTTDQESIASAVSESARR